VTLISLKTEIFRADGAVKAEFSDGTSLSFSTHYLPDAIPLDDEGNCPLWEPGHELSSGEEEACRFAAACYQAEKIALRLIARAEQNSLALTAKLERRKIDAAAAKAVVSRLLDQNLLNNERYAERWIRSQLALRKAPSPQWLLAALGKRGIDRKSSLKALDKVFDPQTEYELLEKYLEKTRISRDSRTFSIRAQLKHEGFSSTVIDLYLDT